VLKDFGDCMAAGDYAPAPPVLYKADYHCTENEAEGSPPSYIWTTGGWLAWCQGKTLERGRTRFMVGYNNNLEPVSCASCNTKWSDNLGPTEGTHPRAPQGDPRVHERFSVYSGGKPDSESRSEWYDRCESCKASGGHTEHICYHPSDGQLKKYGECITCFRYVFDNNWQVVSTTTQCDRNDYYNKCIGCCGCTERSCTEGTVDTTTQMYAAGAHDYCPNEAGNALSPGWHCCDPANEEPCSETLKSPAAIRMMVARGGDGSDLAQDGVRRSPPPPTPPTLADYSNF
jgi:hypothetical protein